MDFFHDDVTKKLHLSGGFGSGKTFILVAKMLKLSYLNKDVPGGAVMPDFSEYRKDFRPALEEFLDRYRIPFKEHKSHHTWRFPWSKAPVQVVSAEKRIRGPNWGWAVLNELTLIPYVRYQETLGRVRVKGAPFPQVASSGTPEGFANEYYEPLIEKPTPGTRVITTSTRDNARNLNEDYIPTLMSNYDSTQQAAFLDGEWVNMVANRFYYKYDSARHDDPGIEWSEYGLQTVIVSMDFNVNPMTATMWQQLDLVPGLNRRKIVAFDQIKLVGDADTNRMARALIDAGYTPDRVVIYADPAGNQRSTKGSPDTKILQGFGFEVRTKASAPRFRQRMLNAANLFDKGLVAINPIKCPDLKKDLLNDSFKPGTFEKDKSNPNLTHFSDGMDYMFDILYPFGGDRDSISSVKVR